MSLSPRLARLRRPATFWALAGASLLVAHDAVFLVQLGPGEPVARALRSGGHAYWEAASGVLLALAGLAALIVAVRIASLVRRVRTLSPRPAGAAASGSRAALAGRLWLRLLAVVVVGFTIQENVEHLAGHQHLIGLGALHGVEYPLALPVLALVTLVAALIGSVVLGIERRLLAAIAAIARLALRAPRVVPRPPLRLLGRACSPLAARGAGRAPPSWLAVPSGG